MTNKKQNLKFAGKQVTPTVDEEDFLFYVGQDDEQETISALGLRQSAYDEEDFRISKYW